MSSIRHPKSTRSWTSSSVTATWPRSPFPAEPKARHTKVRRQRISRRSRLFDIHVHLREPGQNYKESIATGTAAAAAGGFTSVCCMPNTQPVVDSSEWVSWLQHPDRGAVVNVSHRCRNQGQQRCILTDFRLQRAGAIAVTDDGKPILGDDIMRETLRLGAELNFPIIQHAEDTRVTANCSMMTDQLLSASACVE